MREYLEFLLLWMAVMLFVAVVVGTFWGGTFPTVAHIHELGNTGLACFSASFAVKVKIRKQKTP